MTNVGRTRSLAARVQDASVAVADALLAASGDAHDLAVDELHDRSLRIVLRTVVADQASRRGLPDPRLPLVDRTAEVVQLPPSVAQDLAGAGFVAPEELGGAYAAQLGHTLAVVGRTVELSSHNGSRRQAVGAFHTPQPLSDALLAMALPALLERATTPAAVLALRVCDPAAGGGALLLAAARAIAGHLASLRGDADAGGALRDVVVGCLRGVDVDPLAAELTRAALWLAAGDPALPPDAFEAHVLVGDAMLGVGLDAAGPPLSPDGRRRPGPAVPTDALRARATPRDSTPDASDLPPLRRRAVTMAAHDRAPLTRTEQRLVADAWVAAWTLPRHGATSLAPYDVMDAVLARHDAGVVARSDAGQLVTREARRVRALHWHLAFPDVAEAGGFDLVIANPPWERLKLAQRRWFARHGRPDIATAPSAAVRRARIAALADGSLADRAVLARWHQATRDAVARAAFVRTSGRFPCSGRADVNAYAAISEVCLDITAPHGRTALIVPSGLLTDHGTAAFPRRLVDDNRLTHAVGFRDAGAHFASVGVVTFSLVVAAGSAGTHEPQVVLGHGLDDATMWRDQVFRAERRPLGLCNPDTRTMVPVGDSADLALVVALHARHPVLQRAGADAVPGGAHDPWALRFTRPFDMTNDARLFSTDATGRVPLLEGKLVGQHDHRARRMVSPTRTEPDLAARSDPSTPPGAWRFVTPHDVQRRTPPGTFHLVVRLISGRASNRTLVAALAPHVGVGNSLVVLDTPPTHAVLLCGLLNSLPLDHVLRCKIEDANVNVFVLRQLPVPSPDAFAEPAPWDPRRSIGTWIAERVVGLAAASATVAHGLGLDAPVVVDDATRQGWRDDIDAAVFHLYGHTAQQVRHVLASFHGLRRAEEAAGTTGRTEHAVLTRIDAMSGSASGQRDPALPVLPAPLVVPLR